MVVDSASALLEIESILQQLEDLSFVAQRDAREALPVLGKQPADVRLEWLKTARDLFFHDREAGKAFMRGTPPLYEDWPNLRAWCTQARVFLGWVNSWMALEGFMRQAGRVFATQGLDAEQAWYEMGVEWTCRSVEDGQVFFDTDFEVLAGGQGIQGIRLFLRPFEDHADAMRMRLKTYLAGAIAARGLVGADRLMDWAARGAAVMRSGRLRGEAYFALEDEESKRFLLDQLPGYRISEHRRFLRLMLSAWFGGSIPIDQASWRPQAGRAAIETDGRTLFLPPVFTSRDEALVALIHAGGHFRDGTYVREEIEALFSEKGFEHPPLDDDQRITWRPLFAPFEKAMFRFQLLFDLAEDLRVDARLIQSIPGYGTRLGRLLERSPRPDGVAGEFYRWALEQYEALLNGTVMDGRLRAVLEPEAQLIDAFRVAESLFADPAFPMIGPEDRYNAYLPAHGPNTSRPVYPRQHGITGEYGEQLDDRYAGQPQKTHDRHAAAPKGAQMQDPDADLFVPPEKTAGTGGRVGAGIPMPNRTVSEGRASHDSAPAGIVYPEWNYREQAYLPDWAHVIERSFSESKPNRAKRLLDSNYGVMRRLRKVLEKQKPSRMSLLRRQPEGEELDLEATIAHVVERRSGLSPEGMIYRRRQLHQRDTAVFLLADMSTSIMSRLPDGDGKIVDRIRAALILFSEALNVLGDPYAIAGFASNQREQVNYYWFKHFSHPKPADLNARMAALTGHLASRMGAAIRHSVARFQQIDSRHRLLLLLTDGRPSDYDDGGDDRYLQEDTRMAMKEAVDAGIHPFCVTLDPSGGEYLPRIFGHGHYTVLGSVGDLPSRLPEIYLKMRR